MDEKNKLGDQLKKFARFPGDRKKNQDKPLQNMGLGDLASYTMVFVRTFRWTLNPPNHPNVSMWVQKVNANYKEKTLEIEVFEDRDGSVHEWITDMIIDEASRSFVINHYDGCGATLFTNNYSGIEIKEHKVAYDYSNSDVLTHKLKLSYRSLKRSSNLTIN